MPSPLEIEIALHYHCCTDDWGADNPGRQNAPAVADAIIGFMAAGLLRATATGASRRLEPTDGLAVYVKALCEVPWPTQRWMMI